MKCLLFKQEYNFVFIKSQQVIGELIIQSYANFCDMQSRAKLADAARTYLQPNYGNGVLAMFTFQLDNIKR